MTVADQRRLLHNTIWKLANDLRGAVDGWDFKAYVLGILFYRFISENLAEYINAGEAAHGNAGTQYEAMTDEDAELARESIVDEKGFFILPSELFCNVRAKARGDENLNETLAKVFQNIEASSRGANSEDDFKGLFDDLDMRSNKLGNTVKEKNEKLVALLERIGDLDLGSEFQENHIDAFGDAYEYLMTMYASNAGKSGGEFFTPPEVSELLAKIAIDGKESVNRVYDPCCGSGSLLLRVAKVLGNDGVSEGYYGQELNPTTYNLARINMFLHDINFNKFTIALGDTLKAPSEKIERLEPFDVIVSNPPYSTKWEGKNNPLFINDERFSPAGVLAPPSKADLAFTMHMLHCLSSDGCAAIVEFPGVLYRGGAEAKIRKYLLENNFIDTVIQLPPDLFFGTTIATCILVLKKSKRTNDVLFIDASELFERRDSKNHLEAEHRERILGAMVERDDEVGFSKVVPIKDIIDNGVNLSVSAYVEKKDTKEAIDIDALNAEIARMVAHEDALRAKIDELIGVL